MAWDLDLFCNIRNWGGLCSFNVKAKLQYFKNALFRQRNEFESKSYLRIDFVRNTIFVVFFLNEGFLIRGACISQ